MNLVIITSVCRHLVCNVIHSVVPIPHKAHFSALLSRTYITASTLDIMTMPVIVSNTVFQDADSLEHSTTFFSLRGQAL